MKAIVRKERSCLMVDSKLLDFKLKLDRYAKETSNNVVYMRQTVRLFWIRARPFGSISFSKHEVSIKIQTLCCYRLEATWSISYLQVITF